jgi:hypothetical protein
MRLVRPIQGGTSTNGMRFTFLNAMIKLNSWDAAAPLAAIKGVCRSHGSATNLTPLAGYADLIPHFCRISVIGHHLVNAD